MLSVGCESDDGIGSTGAGRRSSIDDISIGIGSTGAGGVRVLVVKGSSLISIDDVSIGSGSVGTGVVVKGGWDVRVSAAAEGSSSIDDDAIGSGGRCSRSVVIGS